MMKLTILHDGKFYVGIVETVSENTLKAYRYVFGAEPKDQDVLDFVYQDLQRLLDTQHQEGVPIDQNVIQKINPKRLQRQVSKEMAQSSISSKAQEAMKKEYEHRKKLKNEKSKVQREA